MLTRSALLFAIAAVSAIVGFPSIFADIRQLAEILGMPPAEWFLWNYLMVGGGLFFMALAAYGMYAHWHSRPSFLHLRRTKPETEKAAGTKYAVDAGGINWSYSVPEPSRTHRRASLWRRMRNRLWPTGKTRKKRLKNRADLQDCLDELIRYSGQAFPSTLSAEEIGASNALLRHLERACVVLDRQGRSHPKIEKGLVIENVMEWIRFLSHLLAQDDTR